MVSIRWIPRWRSTGAVAVLAAVSWAVSSCKPPATKEAASLPSTASPAWFQDVSVQSGIDFKHHPGNTGSYFMPESIGSGGALFDFNNDGRLDVYLVHCAPTNAGARNQLYQQEPDGRFRNVSAGSGLDVTGVGMGVAIGDLNNDGWADVLLTEFGRARLFVNQGGRRFEDQTQPAGIDNTRWGTSAAFFDYDRDGWLDLVIANYVDYSPTIRCPDTRGRLDYCGPQGMQGTATRLFRNRSTREGGVRFEDVSAASGVARKIGAGLGVLCADFDGDRWPDLLVADDGMANRLYMNQRDGTFTEEAAQRGVAFNAFGSAAANMGVAYGDVDGNGLSDIFVTHLSWEQHALWKQEPAGFFQDQTGGSGLGNLRLRGTGFGTVLADFDLDGDLDLAFVNGRVKRGEEQGPFVPGLDPFWQSYAQPAQLFENDGAGKFREISEGNRDFAGLAAVGRGLACGDLDNDGALDMVVMNTGAPVRILRNVAARRGHWLSVRAVDPAWGGRDAHGAEVTLTAGPQRWRRLIQPGYSYLVSNDPRAHFGLGERARYERIEVLWPDGTLESFAGGESDRHLILRRGEGIRP